MTLTLVHDPAVRRRALAAIGSALLVLALTAAHHAYGAAVYAATFRRHVVFVALPLAVIIAAAGAVSIASCGPSGRIARRIAVGLITVFPIGAIGLFEGLYNHVLKNVIFFAGLYGRWGAAMYPPPAYERPGDPVFEITGILQFPVAMFAAIQLWRWLRAPPGVQN